MYALSRGNIYKKSKGFQHMKKLYRGIWAERLESGQELPVGGSIFSDELTIKILLDFDSFKEQLDNYRSPQKVSGLYVQNRSALTGWLFQVGSKIDPYLFFVTNTVQRKVQTLMDVKPESFPSGLERLAKFKDDKARLSDLRGVAMCAEQASFGQYLLQKVLQEGYSAFYMGGVEAQSSSAELGNHSFIVMRGLNSKNYIFDIARPLYGNNLPRVLETDVPFTSELFDKTENLLVGATEVLMGGRSYFGVGHPLLEQQPAVLQC